MTILKCSATTCAYNENNLCSRGEIDVMGESARNADETSCGSFRERCRQCHEQRQKWLRMRNHPD